MAALMQKEFEEKIKRLTADYEFFAHITSHDLRDPLRQARIYSDELLEKLSGEDKHKLESVNVLIDEVLQKIAILRDFSYMESAKGTLAAVDLNKIVNEVVRELSEKIKSAKADLEIGNLPTVNGNAKHLKMIFSALIDNAIKFRNPSKKLQIKINAVDEKDNWHFIILDNGIGLEEVYRELVFVLFQRLDNEVKDGSFGAGLAFAKKAVENHGGKIWYKSDGEEGTEFHFTLRK
jgi:light-regulated signal transduction histidine kinase (bacteriophytochrome)